MRQWSEIPASTHATLRGHHGSDAAIQHLANRVDHCAAHAGVALGQRIRSQQHHGPGLKGRKRVTYAHRMGAHQVNLEGANLLSWNPDVAWLAWAGGNCVG